MPEGASSAHLLPLVVFFHGSQVRADTVYSATNLYEYRAFGDLTGDAARRGYVLLAPQGRQLYAPHGGASSGDGWHWDEWHRDPATNRDALAVDELIEQATATAPVDENRIFVIGWSNGAYFAALYAIWRSDRIAAWVQYAGADPFIREPCPVPLEAARQVPGMVVYRGCDDLVPCPTVEDWIARLEAEDWAVLETRRLDGLGMPTELCEPSPCVGGLVNHANWPNTSLDEIFAFLRTVSL